MERKLLWRIIEKRWEAPEVATLKLSLVGDEPMVTYEPGQYLPLIREFHYGQERRAYSFSSCMETDPQPTLTIKRIPNGWFSTWLVQRVREGDLLMSAEPAGRFLLPSHKPKRLLYVAAGSGIVPIMSHMKAIFHRQAWNDVRVRLLYANRDSEHTIFKHQIDAWMAAQPERFRVTYFFSRERSNATHVEHAHLSRDLFEQYLLAFAGSEKTDILTYLCAPVPLMRMVRMTMRTLGFADKQIIQETFTPDPRLQRRQADPSRIHRIIVTLRNGHRVAFDAYAGETILRAALRQSISLPYTCKSGICLSCLARCVRGEVEVQFVEQTKREGSGAWINTCISYAVSDEVELVL
ncbi:MAG: iron-sulfur cluster-binding domain-containing protein [Saprospiraceae bacterium]|nr:iron-sulfur cluster-binding domain-containing protein [Saprospiraceae bacterium]MDW8482969.1 iron-sulfur cluster-binding domain-containing protein [Saprospiraceae bacterium]